MDHFFDNLKPSYNEIKLVPKETYLQYIHDTNVVAIVNYETGVSQNISIQLLLDIITKDDYYEHLLKLIANKKKVCFTISYANNHHAKENISVPLGQIYPQLVKFSQLNASQYSRVNFLKKLLTIEGMIKQYHDYIYEEKIDNKIVKLTVDQILKVFCMNWEEYNNFLENPNIKMGDLSKEEYVWIVKDFFKKENIILRYSCSSGIIDRYDEIRKQIDYVSINQFTETSDKFVNEIEINSALLEKLFKGINSDYDPLEKAIYIYIRMCQILTYDQEFYAMDQRGEIATYHENIKRVKEISPTNNKIVCYEFNIIYGKILQMLGFNFATVSDNENIFGKGHAFLKFRAGKFLISADAVDTIRHGDLVKAKLGKNVQNLYCYNGNYETREKFKIIFNKVQTDATLLADNRFTEAFEMYRLMPTDPESKELRYQEKLEIFMEAVEDSDLATVDQIGYMYQLRDLMFTEEEVKNQFNIAVIRENLPLKESARIIVILATSLKEFPQETKYYKYDFKTISEIDAWQLKEYMNKSMYEYLQWSENRIPGIIKEEVNNGTIKKTR